MLKRIVVGILGLSVLGAGGAAAIYSSTQNAAPAAVETQPTVIQQDQGQAAIAASVGPEASVGEPWTMSGVITVLDDFGMTLAASDGSEYTIELGPPEFWQAQGVTLSVQESVTVDGYVSEGQYHAGIVTTSSGQQIQVRDEVGRPLWSGGAQNRAGSQNGTNGAGGQGNGLADGSGVPQPQAQVDEWVTVEGVISAIGRNTLTVQATTGETFVIQMGRPSFATSQGITFQVGDVVVVVGFYEGTQFNAGDITQVSTGLRLMLRDPNGRPLWAGPGNANGQGENVATTVVP